MKINFDEEQDSDNTENHMKIPNSDQIFKEQVKLEEIQNIKHSIDSLKIIIIFIIIFCALLIIYQILQDYRVSSYRKEILNLKEQIIDMKLHINNFNEKIDINNQTNTNIIQIEKDKTEQKQIKI